MTSIHADRLFDGLTFSLNKTVHCAGDLIEGVGDSASEGAIALPAGSILAPGFIDLQVNGGGGIMVQDHLNLDGFRHIAAAHAGRGTTTILPTLISGSRGAIAAALALAGEAVAGIPGIGGVHIEGPFIAPARRGIHPASAMTRMTADDLRALCGAARGPIMLTVAPEVTPPDYIRSLAAAGIVVSLGHSDASYEQARAALTAGAACFTHLFNAMSPFAPRAPGMPGAAMNHASAYAGIIADGIHVHPATLSIAHAAIGASRLFLVSDAMATAASDATSFDLYGARITLTDGKLTDAQGTLAGAHLTMAEAVRIAVSLAKIPLADALRMATSTPAACCGMNDRGIIAPGRLADLVALDESYEVIGVWQRGRRV